MRSTPSATRSSPPTRRTGGCSRRRPRASERSTCRLHRRRRVPSRPAPRGRPLRRLVRARPGPRLAAPGPGAGSRPDRPRPRRGRPLPDGARPGPAGRPRRERRLAAPGPHAARRPARLRREPVLATGAASQPAHPSSPTGRPSIIASPRASRRRRTTASAGDGRSPRPPRPTPACSTRPALTLAAFLVGQFGTQTIAGDGVRRRDRPTARPKPPAPMRSTPSPTTRPSPGWPPASGGSSSPTSSTSSRSSRRSPTSRRPAWAKNPSLPWRRSSRTAASSTGPPNSSSGAREPTATRTGPRPSTSTRSSAPGASSRPCGPQPAGRGAAVDFRFRNGRRVHFEAHEILHDKLLKDVKDYISSSPQQLDWQRINIGDIGSRLVDAGQRQYLGRPSPSWDLDLDPLPGHFDRRITVTTPLQKAGAYLLTARMEGGNTSRIVVWLDDTAIIKKPIEEKAYYFVADARTGRPVPRADVELFGWRTGAGRRPERVPRRDQDTLAQDRRRRPAPGPDRRPERPGAAGPTSGSSPPARPTAAWPTRASRHLGRRPARPRL